MFNVLVLGGTRFIGKGLVENLIQEPIEVFISSRRKLNTLSSEYQFTCERSDLPKRLNSLEVFDYIFDFNGYSPESIKQLPQGNPKISYVAISTLWVERFTRNSERFSTLYRERDHLYTIGKKAYESAAMARFKQKCAILRLPIVLGLSDHHGRIQFLLRRILVNSRLITSSLENNLDFIIDFDLITEMTKIIRSRNEFPVESTFQYQKTFNYSKLINLASKELGKSPELLPTKLEALAEQNPNFLENEALMREVQFKDWSPSPFICFGDAQTSLIRLVRSIQANSKGDFPLKLQQEALLRWEGNL